MDFKKIVLYNPAISSLNMGDHIIAEAAKDQLSFMLNDAFTVEVSSHLPISRMYMRHTKDFDYRFVCGSNLLRGKMNRVFRQWDIRFGGTAAGQQLQCRLFDQCRRIGGESRWRRGRRRHAA